MKRLLLALSFIITMIPFAIGTPAQAATCSTSWAWVSCSFPPYNILNNVGIPVTGSSQSLTAANSNNWSVTAEYPGLTANGHYAYPEDQENYNLKVPISKLSTVQQAFSESPPKCTDKAAWEVASDDWLNGTAGDKNAIEIMVWENNCNTFPGGAPVNHKLTIGNQVFTLFVTKGWHRFTLEDVTPVNSGVIHMGDVLVWLEKLGYISSKDSLSQLDMGEEIVYTNGQALTWKFSKCYYTVHE